MHRTKKLKRSIFSLLIVMLLLVQGGLFSSLAAEGENAAGNEVEIPIIGETPVYGITGNMVGELIPPVDGGAVSYQDKTDEYSQPKQVAVYAVRDQGSPKYYKPETGPAGMLQVVLRFAPEAPSSFATATPDEATQPTEDATEDPGTAEDATDAVSDASAPEEPASEEPASEEPASEEQVVWIDGSLIACSYIESATAATPIPVAVVEEPAPTAIPEPTELSTPVPGESEDASSDMKEKASVRDILPWIIVALVALVLLAICAGSIFIRSTIMDLNESIGASGGLILRQLKEVSAKVSKPADYSQILQEIRGESLTHTYKYGEIISKIDQIGARLPLPPLPPPPPPPSPEQRAIEVAESLYGVQQMQSWVGMLDSKGFSYALIMPANTNEQGVYQTAPNTTSKLACIWMSNGQGDAYVIPSWNDAYAFDPYWQTIYSMQGSQQKRYDKLVKVSRVGDFIKLMERGIMRRS